MPERRSDPLAGVIVVSSIVALVVLHLTGHGDGTADLVSLVGPVIAAVFVVQSIGPQVAATRSAVEQTARQTNGVLDQRIKDNVKEALAEHLPSGEGYDPKHS